MAIQGAGGEFYLASETPFSSLFSFLWRFGVDTRRGEIFEKLKYPAGFVFFFLDDSQL
jgi:hypothetical protein